MFKFRYLLVGLLIIVMLAFFTILIKVNIGDKESIFKTIIYMAIVAIDHLCALSFCFLLIPYYISINLKNIYIKLTVQISFILLYFIILFLLGGYKKLALSENILFIICGIIFCFISNINLSKQDGSFVKTVEEVFIIIPRLMIFFNVYMVYTYFIEYMVKIYT